MMRLESGLEGLFRFIASYLSLWPRDLQNLKPCHPERSEGPLLIVRQALKQRSFAALRMTRKEIQRYIRAEFQKR